MHGRRLTLAQIHALSPAQRAERVAELLAKAVAIRMAQASSAQAQQPVATSALLELPQRELKAS
jgi:hypothetical protein